MRTHCKECGHATNKGMPVCAYCRTGRTRPVHPCDECGDPVEVRRVQGGRYRCEGCRTRVRVEAVLAIAKPILERGGTLREIARSLQLSGERVRQILASHPDLGSLRRSTVEERCAALLAAQLSAGLVLEEAARACGMAQHVARGVAARAPELQAQAAVNRARLRTRQWIERFAPVYSLVQASGISIGAACRRLGVPCRILIYDIARTAEAQARFPRLREVPRRRRITFLELGPRPEGLQSAG